MHASSRASTRVAIAFVGVALAGMAGANAFLGEQAIDQRQRDLIRIFSEVFQRAQSQSVLGEIVRPKYGSPQINFPESAEKAGWRPHCGSAIAAEPSDPSQHPFALVLAPRDAISQAGATFEVYAIFSGPNPLPRGIFDRSLPDWLTAQTSGYQELRSNLETIIRTSEISVETMECDGFSIATISGESR